METRQELLSNEMTEKECALSVPGLETKLKHTLKRGSQLPVHCLLGHFTSWETF